jgi:hypothetical protein
MVSVADSFRCTTLQQVCQILLKIIPASLEKFVKIILNEERATIAQSV